MTVGIQEGFNTLKERAEAVAAWLNEERKRADVTKRAASGGGGGEGIDESGGSSAAVGRGDRNSTQRGRQKIMEWKGFTINPGSYLVPNNNNRSQLIIQQSSKRRRKGKSNSSSGGKKKKQLQQQQQAGGVMGTQEEGQETSQGDVESGQMNLSPSLIAALGGNVLRTEVSNKDFDD